MATTSSKGRSTQSRKGGGSTKSRKGGGSKAGAGNVSLSEADRTYLQESLGDAARRGIAAVGTGASSLFEALGEFGLNSERVERLREALGNVEVKESVEKAQEYLAEQIENAREYARENPKKVIGGAAGVLVGASLLALAISRATGKGSRSAAGRKGGKKSSGGGAKKRSSSGGSKKSTKRR